MPFQDHMWSLLLQARGRIDETRRGWSPKEIFKGVEGISAIHGGSREADAARTKGEQIELIKAPGKHKDLTQRAETHRTPARGGQSFRNPAEAATVSIPSQRRKLAAGTPTLLPTLAQGTAQAAEGMHERRYREAQSLRARV